MVKTKGICGGEPVIKGTRMPVRIVTECWRSGLSPEEIRHSYPQLELASIFDALSYAEDHEEQIDRLIERHRQAHEKGRVAHARP